MTYPVDHPVLDLIADNLIACAPRSRPRRESECVEFWCPENCRWYEIVVRPIDEPSRAREAAEASA